MQEILDLWEQAKHHPILSAVVALYLLLTVIGNHQLSPETAAKWQKFAMVWVLAQRWGAIFRGAAKPLLGLVLPSAAKEVIESIFPGAFSPDSKKPAGGP